MNFLIMFFKKTVEIIIFIHLTIFVILGFLNLWPRFTSANRILRDGLNIWQDFPVSWNFLTINFRGFLSALISE